MTKHSFHRLTSKIVLVFLCLFFAAYLFTLVYVANNAFVDSTKPADVILVLGTDPGKKDKVNPCLVTRMDYALELYKQGIAKKMIFSGGKLPGYRASEASVMESLAKERSTSASAYFVEDKSASTFENLTFARRIMQENNLISAIIVTDPYHSPRAGLIAKKMGLDYSLSPAKDSPCSHDLGFVLYFLLREPLAMMYYKVTGRL